MRASRSCLLSVVLVVGCGDDQQSTPDAKPDAVDYTIGEHPQLAVPCDDSLADVYTLPDDLEEMDDSRRGEILRCAKAEKLTVPEIREQIEAYNTGYDKAVPGTVRSGFWSYRVAYRSTRNTVDGTRAEGDSAAFLLVPANPLPGAPLVVFGHGSVGIASKCAPSRLDLSAPAQDHDYPPMLYRLAGYGFYVIAPDYNGFSYGQTPGYFNAEDEAHAVLDATRAAAKLLPMAPDKVAFVGHSQGGHAVIAAHAYAKTYGMAGTLVGVATLSPVWNSMSMWAAATAPLAMLTTEKDTNAILYAMSYAYSASELREPETGVSVFQTDKQDAARDVILNDCYDKAGLVALGENPSDFFDEAYVEFVGSACAVNPFLPDCSHELAVKWKARWEEDRPAIDANGAPILAVFGGMDTTVPIGRAACARNKLTGDLGTGASTTLTFCLDAMLEHRDIVRSAQVEYLNEWVAAKAGAGPEPAACTPFPTDLDCQTPPHDY